MIHDKPWICCNSSFLSSFLSWDNTVLLLWLDLATQKHLARVRSRYIFGLKYLFWLPQTWQEGSQGFFKDTFGLLSKLTIFSSCKHGWKISLEIWILCVQMLKYCGLSYYYFFFVKVVSNFQMLKRSLELWPPAWQPPRLTPPPSPPPLDMQGRS